MCRFAIFAAVATTLMAATSALAQQGTGFHVGASAGINLLQDNADSDGSRPGIPI
jgi:hypothetical protein